MPRLTASDTARIEAAVARAERRTSGEFVAVLTPESDRYHEVRLGLPAVVALLLPWAAMAVGYEAGLMRLAQAQILLFAALAVLLQWTPLAMRLVPERVRRRRAAWMARAEFHDIGVHATTDRAGVLLFVSAAERHVEVLADRGIAARVDPAAWQAIVDRFVGEARTGGLADACVEAIDSCGALLAQHFPRRPDDANELPDAVRQPQ